MAARSVRRGRSQSRPRPSQVREVGRAARARSRRLAKSARAAVCAWAAAGSGGGHAVSMTRVPCQGGRLARGQRRRRGPSGLHADVAGDARRGTGLALGWQQYSTPRARSAAERVDLRPSTFDVRRAAGRTSPQVRLRGLVLDAMQFRPDIQDSAHARVEPVQGPGVGRSGLAGHVEARRRRRRHMSMAADGVDRDCLRLHGRSAQDREGHAERSR